MTERKKMWRPGKGGKQGSVLMSPLGVVCFACWLLLVGGVLRAEAAPLAFSTTLDGRPATLTAESHDVQQVLYVSLSDLVQQLGGTIQIMPARILIDLNQASVMANMNNTRIDTTQASFAITYPIVRHEEDALLAAADVPAFFTQAFAQPVSPVQARLPESPAPPPLAEEPDPSAPAIAMPEPSPAPPMETPPPPAEEITEDLLSPIVNPTAGAVWTIVLDAGHGGQDAGVTGAGGLLEKDLTLSLVKEVAAILKEESRCKVLLSRKDDRDCPVRERAEVASKENADLFISLHAGASYDPQAQGIELYYPSEHGALLKGDRDQAQRIRRRSEQSRVLARAMQKSIEANDQTRLRAIRPLPLQVFLRLEIPGLLIEIGCLSSASEESRLARESYRHEVAKTLAAGIIAALPETQRGEKP